ncbi:MAG: hypothetical protein ACK4MD_03685 [Demequina sp.]
MSRANGSGEDIQARLDNFLESAHRSVARLEELQRDIQHLATVPPPSAVTATVDESGRLIGLTINQAARAELPSGALDHDVNLALVAAHRERPVPHDGVPPEPSGFDLASVLEQVFSGQAGAAPAAPPAPPEPVWNDARTVGVVTVEGVTQSVVFAEGWTQRQSEASIAAEVVRTAALPHERA